MKKIILASASPRRRELLTQVGLTFEVIPSEATEECSEISPEKIVEALALRKAEEVANKIIEEKRGTKERDRTDERKDFIVIGSDTIVSKDGLVLGKPDSEKKAFQMLSMLQGSVHQVYSGVALVIDRQNQITTKVFHVKTDVEVFPMTQKQIYDYIATGDCMDKAGAYGIQGCFAEYIKGIAGDYYNVVGLPVSRLMQELRPYLTDKEMLVDI